MTDNKPPVFKDEELKLPNKPFFKNTEAVEKSRFTPLVLGTLIILLLGILAGLYVWHQMVATPEVVQSTARPTAEENQEPESTTARAQTDSMQTVSPSDSLDAIEADLESTDLTTLDSDFSAIDAEVEASAE